MASSLTPLEEVAALDPGLAKLLSSNEYVGLGDLTELANGQFQLAIMFRDGVFRIINADKSLIGVFSSWDAALQALARLKPVASTQA